MDLSYRDIQGHAELHKTRGRISPPQHNQTCNHAEGYPGSSLFPVFWRGRKPFSAMYTFFQDWEVLYENYFCLKWELNSFVQSYANTTTAVQIWQFLIAHNLSHAWFFQFLNHLGLTHNGPALLNAFLLARERQRQKVRLKQRSCKCF